MKHHRYFSFNVVFLFCLSLGLGILLLSGCSKRFPDELDERAQTSSILPVTTDTNATSISPIPNAFEN